MKAYPGRILAIDYGTKRVGIAVSDPTRMIAQGVTTLNNDEHLLEALCRLVLQQEAVTILVGMPYSEDGRKGAKALEVEQFIERLKNAVDLQVETWDESYSSVNAHRVFVETGMKRKKRREKKRVDEMAARLTLQEYLDHHSQRPTHSG
ncbi:MAG TPA: Holliday junction resolvase RuvX [Bacteroidetes bacterium]|nr:Holliday junction resolvase RuvX [Bacteroidota bacterium]